MPSKVELLDPEYLQDSPVAVVASSAPYTDTVTSMNVASTTRYDCLICLNFKQLQLIFSGSGSRGDK